MNPDFTLIWSLSCLKDEDHLWLRDRDGLVGAEPVGRPGAQRTRGRPR